MKKTKTKNKTITLDGYLKELKIDIFKCNLSTIFLCIISLISLIIGIIFHYYNKPGIKPGIQLFQLIGDITISIFCTFMLSIYKKISKNTIYAKDCKWILHNINSTVFCSDCSKIFTNRSKITKTNTIIGHIVAICQTIISIILVLNCFLKVKSTFLQPGLITNHNIPFVIVISLLSAGIVGFILLTNRIFWEIPWGRPLIAYYSEGADEAFETFNEQKKRISHMYHIMNIIRYILLFYEDINKIREGAIDITTTGTTTTYTPITISETYSGSNTYTVSGGYSSETYINEIPGDSLYKLFLSTKDKISEGKENIINDIKKYIYDMHEQSINYVAKNFKIEKEKYYIDFSKNYNRGLHNKFNFVAFVDFFLLKYNHPTLTVKEYISNVGEISYTEI